MPTAILAVSILIAALLLYLVIRTVRESRGRSELIAENARLETELELQNQRSDERIRFLEESEKRLKTEFENIAGRLFEKTGKAFSERNSEGITSLLKPFREQLDSFRKQVEQGEKERIRDNTKLKEEIRHLAKFSEEVREDANNLARAGYRSFCNRAAYSVFRAAEVHRSAKTMATAVS